MAKQLTAHIFKQMPLGLCLDLDRDGLRLAQIRTLTLLFVKNFCQILTKIQSFYLVM